MSLRLASALYRWRFPLVALVVLGAVALGPHANITEIDNDITAWFSREDPVYQDYERFRREFGGTRTLIVALESPRLYTREGLEFLRVVTTEIERVPTVERVQSLAAANLITTAPAAGDEPGSLEVRPLLDRLAGRGPDAVRAEALGDPLIRGDLVSEDGTVTAVVVTFDEDRVDEVRAGVLGRIRHIVDSTLPDGMRAYYNGSLEISETYNRVTLQNQRTFTPPIMALTLIGIYAMFRSVRKTLLAFCAILLSVAWTLGIYALLGFTYNVLASMIIPLIVVLAISDDVHIMQHYEHVVREGAGPEAAFTGTVAYLLAPLLAASGTTALGMLSLATSQVVAVRTFGIGAAIGVMVDFAITIVFLPTMLALVKPEPGRAPQERYLTGPMRRIARLATAQPARIAGAALLVALVASLGILRLRVDTNHINFFSPRHPLSRSAAVIDEKLSGVYSFQILLEGPAGAMQEPATLRRVDTLQAQLAELPYVRKVTSLADYVKRINQTLNDGDEAAWAIPARREVIAQELFVFSLADEGRRELERLVTSDHAKAQIGVRLASMSSDLVFEQVRRAERLAREAFAGTPIVATVTGSGRLFSTLDHYLVTSQLSSFATAFVTVFGVIFLIFRSLRFGLVAIVPNLFPVLAVLGLMGWVGVSLNVATVMLASVTLGVVDDDTIHFINRYRRETSLGAGTDRAIEQATIYEGRAALTTVLINSLGFAVLLGSEYRPTAWFGGLLALTLGVALLAEVFILPATMKLLPRFFAAEAVARVERGVALDV